MKIDRTSGNINHFPRQKISSSKKTETWAKKCMEAGEELTLSSDSIRAYYETKKTNYNLANDILDPEDIQKVFNPLGFKSGDIPASINNYNISMSKIMLLVGEEKKRRFEHRIVALNEDSFSARDTEKKDKLIQIVNEELQALLEGGELNEQQVQKRLQELDKYMKYEYKDIRELTANRVIEHLWKEQDLAYQKNLAFMDALISSEELYRTDIIAGNPIGTRVNPLNLFSYRNGESNRLEDADLIIEIGYEPLGKVLDEFYDHLTPKVIDYLEKGEDTNEILNGNVNYQMKSPVFSAKDLYAKGSGKSKDMDLIDPIAVDELNPGIYGGNFNENGEIRVLRMRWLSFLKRYKLCYFDDNGDKQEEIVDEHYKLTEDDKLNGRTLEEFWIKEWWEGTKLADKYIKMQPRPIQFRNMTNLASAQSGYVGTYYNINSSRARSLMDVMKPIQYLYNITMRRIELAFANYRQPILQLNTTLKPDDWDTDKWLYYAQVHGLLAIDPMNEGQEGAAKGKLAGSMNTFTNEFLNPQMGNYIQFHIQYLEYLENLLGTISGVNKQREGDASPNQTLGGLERGVTQSSHITEYWFAQHENTVKRFILTLLETAKYAYKDEKNKSIPYVLDDLSIQLLNLDGELFNESEYDLYVSDNGRDTEIYEMVKQQIHPFMQNGGKISDAISILRSDSMTQMTRKLEYSEDQIQEQASQQQQQAIQSQEKMKEQDLQFEQYKVDLDAQLEREKMDVQLSIAQANLDNDNDVNNNRIADDLERQRMDLENKKIEYEKQYKGKDLAEKIRSNKAKESIQRQKPSTVKKTN